MKTSLCSTCVWSLIRKMEGWKDTREDDITYHLNACMKDGALVEVVTECNGYKKIIKKTTYHDPKFREEVEQA